MKTSPSTLMRICQEIEQTGGDSAVFVWEGMLGVFPVGSDRGQKMLRDFPQRLVGVYHKTAPAHLVIEDIKECL